MMVNLNKFCEYMYHSSYIPIYLFSNNELTSCYPAHGKDIAPPTNYLSTLWSSHKKVTYTITSVYSYYGCIKLENSNDCIVIGPINDFPYTQAILSSMRREFFIEATQVETFYEFFHNIPTMNLDTFINTLLFINFSVNATELTRKDIEDSEVAPFEKSINQKYSETSYEEKEEGYLNSSYETESELVRAIESGNLSRLYIFLNPSRKVKIGTIANDNLRQWKNMLIVTVTLASRAAMKGGLTPSIAYQLSNVYMQQVERISTLESIQSLFSQVLKDYTNRVANSIIPATADSVLYQAIQYVRENTNKSITVADVASHVGFTRPSLSRKVKKELGFEMSAFIRKCKLEDAKDLLSFSNKSISEISNYLCFSSQSHFQRTFKEYFGMTPQTFRKSTKTT